MLEFEDFQLRSEMNDALWFSTRDSASQLARHGISVEFLEEVSMAKIQDI